MGDITDRKCVNELRHKLYVCQGLFNRALQKAVRWDCQQSTVTVHVGLASVTWRHLLSVCTAIVIVMQHLRLGVWRDGTTMPRDASGHSPKQSVTPQKPWTSETYSRPYEINGTFKQTFNNSGSFMRYINLKMRKLVTLSALSTVGSHRAVAISASQSGRLVTGFLSLSNASRNHSVYRHLTYCTVLL